MWHQSPTVWDNDDIIAALRQHWSAGLSATQCRNELNRDFRLVLTRSSVMGKVRRLGLPRRAKHTKTHIGGNKRTRRAAMKPEARQEIVEEIVDNTPAHIPTNPRMIWELQSHHCRWICTGVGADSVYCGGHRRPGMVFCARHSAVAYRPDDRRH